MVRIDCLIFGYRRLKIEPGDLSLLTSLFLRNSVFSSIDSDGTIIVKEKEIKKIRDILKGRIEFECSEPLGLCGKWLTMDNKGIKLAACIISLIIALLLSGVVWDIRVSGNETLSSQEIVEMLSDSGFAVGDFWLFCDRGKIETNMLALGDRLAWININRRGTVAYVRVIEREEEHLPDDEARTGYSNIVAKADCVIEEITVTRGVAVVKPGDVVKKGDLLVAGVLPAESGGGFCYAEATVMGRVSDRITVELGRDYTKKEYLDSQIYSITLNFFNFSINIFKKYGNLTNEYDIIEDEITYTHLDKYRLPVSLTVCYIPVFDNLSASYGDDELVKLAADRLSQLTAERLVGSDLLKIKTEGDFTAEGYRISSKLVILTDVGENLEFSAN